MKRQELDAAERMMQNCAGVKCLQGLALVAQVRKMDEGLKYLIKQTDAEYQAHDRWEAYRPCPCTFCDHIRQARAVQLSEE